MIKIDEFGFKMRKEIKNRANTKIVQKCKMVNFSSDITVVSLHVCGQIEFFNLTMDIYKIHLRCKNIKKPRVKW